MDNALNFIKKSNHVLFFLAVTLFIVVISIEFISDFFDHRYEPPKIALVDNSDTQEQIKQTQYTKEYSTKLRDVYIFELISKEIDITQHHNSEIYSMFTGSKVSHDLYNGHFLSRNAVNLMFVRENSKPHMLLRKDGLLLEFSKARFSSSEENHLLNKNIYRIINEDTNRNGYLDHEDSAKLFTSTFDGKDLSLILEDVGSFRTIENNKLLISQEGQSPQFYTFDLTSSTLLALDTSIKTSREKL
ncbi:hypothetical protein [Pseudoalteromonas umbrosa]|uniref:hypothetical protein n=1 Tax=Pseudoalteromonas umbrosa TaxID=3048489 RepID=UPI0024C3F209|nr:hypothetical protein [Pseudoalteromonas sp. B95]MDK1286821.1 hypothetical protein [Pseudoalteromonas sp. B95]